MIHAISEYTLNIYSSGKPIRTWFQTILAVLLKPAANERPEEALLKIGLFPLMNKGFSSVVDLTITFEYFTQPILYYELYNMIQFVEIAILLTLHLCIMVVISVTLRVRCNTGTVVRPQNFCKPGRLERPSEFIFLSNTGTVERPQGFCKPGRPERPSEGTEILADFGGALSHMSIFRSIQIHQHFLSGGRKWPLEQRLL